MPITNTTDAYGTITKTFHWLTALLILTIIPLGAIANRLPFETDAQLALKAQLFSFHKTLGVMVFAVALMRILWAMTQPKPGELHPERTVETFLANLVHWLLYISLIAVPLTGWIHHASTAGFAPILLPIGQDLPLIPKDETLSELFAGLHWIWSKIMVGAILLHIAGALKHAFVDKDATFGRMWFGRTNLPETAGHAGSRVAPVAAIVIYALATGAGAATGILGHAETTEGTELADVASDWTVQDGTIALTITQLGSPVSGTFEDWTAAINFDPDAGEILGDVTTTIAIGSLQLGSVTSQAMGADFFDAAAFPTAEFQANITAGESDYLATGTLTIKGNAVPVTLPFTLDITDDQAAMAGTLSLDRRDFGIGQSVGDESNLGFGVDVEINLTATRSDT
ncbi:cytochrome b/b6 domain-containing protein [Yoonia sp. 2307UL14-13]|uniref:cytochrome b/b6 domain-containing protein n=1 Tax=Yoonia sp. 2307UL14-13 TaxID=3126506 RepID=UPI003098DF84